MITLSLPDHCTVQLCSNKDDVKGRQDAKSDCFDTFALIFFLYEMNFIVATYMLPMMMFIIESTHRSYTLILI